MSHVSTAIAVIIIIALLVGLAWLVFESEICSQKGPRSYRL